MSGTTRAQKPERPRRNFKRNFTQVRKGSQFWQTTTRACPKACRNQVTKRESSRFEKSVPRRRRGGRAEEARRKRGGSVSSRESVVDRCRWVVVVRCWCRLGLVAFCDVLVLSDGKGKPGLTDLGFEGYCWEGSWRVLGGLLNAIPIKTE